MDIKLYVYDLSHGLARQASRQFLGIQIDAIYHTSLVFSGIEYFFGRGIQTSHPGKTHHGNPMEVLSLGQTELPLDIIRDYLDELKQIYTPESYDLFAHNCNNFTNDFAMFLVGQGIPDHITSLPKTVLDTPFGQLLRPQIDRAMRPVTQAPSASLLVSDPSAQVSTSNGIYRNGTSQPGVGAQTKTSNATRAGRVQNVTTPQALDELLNEAKASCAVIFFTSATCAPCKMLYPIYDDLAAEAESKATFIKVDVANARDIGLRYSISATPTFMTTVKGEQLDRWTGSDAAQLRGNISVMLQAAYPPHPHQSLRVKYLPRLGDMQLITYNKIPSLDKLATKMGEQGQNKIVQECIVFIRSRGDGENAQSVPVPNLPDLGLFLIQSLELVPIQSLFTVYDLFRMLLVDPRISGYFLAEKSLKTIVPLLTHVIKLQQESSSSTPAIPYSLQLCAIHVACNLFTSNLLQDSLRSPLSEQLASSLVALLTAAILDEAHPALRVAASSLAFNIAKLENTERLSAISATGSASPLLPESTQVELAASLIEVITKSISSSQQQTHTHGNSSSPGSSLPTSSEANTDAAAAALRYQTVALAHLIYLAPLDSELYDLCDALDVQALFPQPDKSTSVSVRARKMESEAERTTSLMKEMNLLLDKKIRAS